MILRCPFQRYVIVLCQLVSVALSRLHVTRYVLQCHIVTASRWLTGSLIHQFQRHVPPSLRRSRSAPFLLSTPILHLDTRTHQATLVQPPALLRRGRTRRARNLRLPRRFRRVLLYNDDDDHNQTEGRKEARTGSRAFPRPKAEGNRALQPQHLAFRFRAAGRRRGALARHFARRRACV